MFQRCFKNSMLSCLYSVLLFSPFLSAEQLSLPSGDLIAPLVKFNPKTDVIDSGDYQKITVSVSDNVGVQSVTLFYRIIGTNTYRRNLMTANPVSDKYSTRIFDVKEPGLEYYIQAVDFAGNTVLSGQSFSPLVINVKKEPLPILSTVKPTLNKKIPPESEKTPRLSKNQTQVVDTAQKERSGTKQSEGASSNKWLWIGLGALAIGGLVAAGSENDPTPTVNAPSTGTVVISAPIP